MGTIDIEKITLTKGSHSSRDKGVCFNEAAAWLAGEPHSDSPKCVCPAVRAATMRLNDIITDDATRNELMKPLLLKAVGSASTHKTYVKRGFVAADFTVRVIAPAWLDLAGKPELAAKLRAMTSIINKETAIAACDFIRSVYPRSPYYYAAAAADAAAISSKRWYEVYNATYKRIYEKLNMPENHLASWKRGIQMIEAMLAVK